jgi:hypothetical protein
MTSQEASDREPQAPAESVLHQSKTRVLRATRGETTCRRQHGRRDDLVGAQGADGKNPQHGHALAPGMAASAWRSCPCSASKEAVSAAGRPMMTSAARAGAAARDDRNASRRRRRARLRCTALRSCRLTANPTRVGSSASRQSTISAGRSMRLPRWKSAWKSARVVSRCRLESPPVRRSAAFGPLRDGASTPFVRPLSSCARESRASWPVVADWVETSASYLEQSSFPIVNRYNRDSVGTPYKRVNRGTPLRLFKSVC